MAVSKGRSEVRAAGRQARRALQGADRVRSEAALVGHLRSLAAIDAPTVGVFVANDGEPDLQPLIEWMWGRDQTVVLPVLEPDPADFSMRFEPWDRGDELVAGRYGIPVPPPGPTIDPATLLVSLTGFDPAGNRIGRGAGFFDRYLATTNSQVIGVGFEVQRFDTVPVEDHDISLPVVVTDLGVRFVA